MQYFASANSAVSYLDTIRAISAGGRAILSGPSSTWETEWPHDFVMFMDQIIHGNKMKRKDIIARSGLDPDYAYKLLNGRKKTRERDYILALCIGAGLNIQQTQHALICSGMLPLSDSDTRSRIIIMGIQSNLSVYHINGHLEDQHLPMIRISGDMPSAAISDSFRWEPTSDSTGQPPASGSSSPKKPEKEHTYTIHDIAVEEGKKEPADIIAEDYRGTAVVTDEDNNRYYLEFIFLFGDDDNDVKLYTRTEEQYQAYCRSKNGKESEPRNAEPESMESYSSLIDATGSEFFLCFLQIEEALHIRMDQSISEADDTKHFGMRCDLSLAASEADNQAAFIEIYNSANPELKEYYQLVRYLDGKCIFTGSHESRFQELRLGHGYRKIYSDRKEHECFFQADQQTIADAEPHFRYFFRRSRYHLNLYLIEEYNGFGLDSDTLHREVLEFATDQAWNCIYSKRYEDARTSLLDAQRMIDGLSDPKERMIHSAGNYSRMRITAEQLNKPDEAKKYRTKLLQIKKKALKQDDTLTPEEQHKIFSPVCTMLYNDYISLCNADKEDAAFPLLDELLDLVENHYGFSDEDSFQRMYLFFKQAERFCKSDFQQAETYYRKAIKETLTHHLDTNADYCDIIPILYNNYAAQIRDNIGYPEAMIYYGRALEIFEAARYNGHTFSEYELSAIEHVGNIMTGFYESYNYPVEKDRLLRRLEAIKMPQEKPKT